MAVIRTSEDRAGLRVELSSVELGSLHVEPAHMVSCRTLVHKGWSAAPAWVWEVHFPAETEAIIIYKYRKNGPLCDLSHTPHPDSSLSLTLASTSHGLCASVPVCTFTVATFLQLTRWLRKEISCSIIHARDTAWHIADAQLRFLNC